jgi:hypothetical protein
MAEKSAKVTSTKFKTHPKNIHIKPRQKTKMAARIYDDGYTIVLQNGD